MVKLKLLITALVFLTITSSLKAQNNDSLFIEFEVQVQEFARFHNQITTTPFDSLSYLNGTLNELQGLSRKTRAANLENLNLYSFFDDFYSSVLDTFTYRIVRNIKQNTNQQQQVKDVEFLAKLQKQVWEQNINHILGAQELLVQNTFLDKVDALYEFSLSEQNDYFNFDDYASRNPQIIEQALREQTERLKLIMRLSNQELLTYQTWLGLISSDPSYLIKIYGE